MISLMWNKKAKLHLKLSTWPKFPHQSAARSRCKTIRFGTKGQACTAQYYTLTYSQYYTLEPKADAGWAGSYECTDKLSQKLKAVGQRPWNIIELPCPWKGFRIPLTLSSSQMCLMFSQLQPCWAGQRCISKSFCPFASEEESICIFPTYWAILFSTSAVPNS